MKHLSLLILGLSLLYPVSAYSELSAEDLGSLEVVVKLDNGDRIEPWGTFLKVYRDAHEYPISIIDPMPHNPYVLDSLPLGHKYSVEVYIDGMFAGSGATDLISQEKLTITIVGSGGIRFNVFYNDNFTPVEEAIVTVKSHDGRLVREDITDSEGKTVRFWMQSTNLDNEYYTSTVSLGSRMKFIVPVIRLEAGMLKDIDVVTPWVASVDELKASIFKTESEKVNESDGKFLLELHDSKGKKIATALANRKGDAYFNNLKVGEYVLHTVREHENPPLHTEYWGEWDVTLERNSESIKLVRSEPYVINWQVSNNSTRSFQHSTLSTTIFNPASSMRNSTISLILDRDRSQPYDIVQNLTLSVRGGSLEDIKTTIINSGEGVYYLNIRVISSEDENFVTDQIPWEHAFEVTKEAPFDIALSVSKKSIVPNENIDLTYSITDTGIFPWHFYVKHLLRTPL